MKGIDLPKRRLTLAKRIARFLKEKKGLNPTVLDLRTLWDEVDFFVVISGQSVVHTKALCDHLVVALEQIGIIPEHIEGYENGIWILVDIGDTVIHIFLDEARQYYDLENLWGLAVRYNI